MFAKWRRREAREKLRIEEPVAGGRPPTAPGAHAVSAPGLIAGLASLVLAAVLVAVLLTAPSGRGVPPSAQRIAGDRFALVAPDGWQLSTRDCPSSGPPCPVASLARLPDPGQAEAEAAGRPTPNLTVTLFSGPARVLPGDGKEQFDVYLSDLRSQVDAFAAGPRRWTEVDGLAALRTEGSGPKHVKEEVRKPLILKEAQAVAELRKRNPTQSVITYTARFSGKQGDYVPEVVVDPGEYREADYRLVLGALLVSGRGHTLRLGYVCDESSKAECDGALEALARSVRVLDRPRRVDIWTHASLQPG